MSEHPILFSGAMIRAILAGTKTQTRRVMRLPGYVIEERELADGVVVPWPWYTGWAHGDSDDGWAACPYGLAGGSLWVRETWQTVRTHPVGYGLEIIPPDMPQLSDGPEHRVLYRATDDDGLSSQGFKWRPSIHMPRWASRVTLRVESVRAERLQEITEEGARAEGIVRVGTGASEWGIPGDGFNWQNARECYASLWNRINLKRAPWASNPWVWVVTFKRAECRKAKGKEVERG